MGELVLASGLRRKEFGHLLVHEIPPLPSRRTEVPVPFLVSHSLGKGGKQRTTWISYDALVKVHDYMAMERAVAAIGSTWWPATGEPLLVERPDWEGATINGRRRSWRVPTVRERLRLVEPGGGSSLLALQSRGAPFVDRATVFARASRRIRARFTARDIARVLVAAGPLGHRELCDRLGLRYQAAVARAARSADLLGQMRGALFPTREVANAYKVLFAAYTGIVPDGISSLGLDDIVWAGDSDILLSYIKGRTGPEGLHLPRRAVRLLERWLASSAPLRRFAPEPLRSQLWIYTYGPGRSPPPR
ncbi:hypothetical protein [Streptosporangium sp. CA-115845]|uniref:hypothetical protein n=1 Tax=Streptosporangium sp. CA-115845 TaxID=3240071 RepID=UPI003D939D03